MRNSTAMSHRLHFPLHSGGPNRNCPSQFISRYCTSRHLLRRSPLPLRPVYGCCICHRCCFRTLIPVIYRIHPTQHMNQNPLWGNVRRCQFNILPPTLPRTSRNASAVLRLPRRLHPLKHNLLYWIPNLPCSSNHVPVHHLRSIRCQT